MTDPNEEQLARHRELHTAIAEALTPLLGQNGKGLIALRVFYAVREDDGRVSMGQAGLTPEDEKEIGMKLLATIATVLVDPDGNHEVRRVEVPPRQ